MKKWTFPAVIALAMSFWACQASPGEEAKETGPAPEEKSEAQLIIDRAISTHGGDRVSASQIEFDFRGRHYRANRQGGIFTYERIFTDSTGRRIHDVLSNEGLYREVDGQPIALSAKDSAAYANSVNSVIYFALLPYFLNDPAARKTYIGESMVKGEPYQKIRVTFRQEGGGKDFEDEFVYWFHTDRHTMDYLAYNYQTNGGGARFREAYNVREGGGIRFADYVNYKPRDGSMAVATFDSLFTAGGLEELSRIETENIQVRPLAAEQ